MNKNCLWLIGLVVTLWAAPGSAAEGPYRQGSWEVRLSSTTAPAFVPSIAYYLADHVALTGSLIYLHQEITDKAAGVTDTTEMDDMGLQVGGEMTFQSPQSAVAPYVGLSIQYRDREISDATGSFTATGPLIQVAGGLKVMAGARASVNVGFTYLTGTLDVEETGFSPIDREVSEWAGLLGYSVYF